MKIYDCFTFFNELDLLEIRLSELYNYVDYFVIVEGDKTHAGNKKEYLLEKNKDRYNKYWDKIIYIKKELPSINLIDKIFISLEKKYPKIFRPINCNLNIGRWKLERFQRKSIKDGLENAEDEDIIIVSDLDEIPNKNKFKEMKLKIKDNKILILEEKMFYCYINGMVQEKWIGTKACSFLQLKKRFHNNPEFLRIPFWFDLVKSKLGIKKLKFNIIENAGWHFSYLGGPKKIKEKKLATCQPEDNKKDDSLEKIKTNLINGKIDLGKGLVKIKFIPIDNSFPDEIKKNKSKYKKIIK